MIVFIVFTKGFSNVVMLYAGVVVNSLYGRSAVKP